MSGLRILRVKLSFLLLFPILLLAQGQVFWQENGVCVCDGFFDGGSKPLAIVNDGSGGVIITWADSRGVYHEAVFAQKIDKDGHCIWTINGVSLKDSIWVPQIISAVSDGKGGAICVWKEAFTPSYLVQITAQRIDSLGQVRWGPNGIVVIGTNADCIYYPTLISDGRGGAIVAWLAEESNPYSWKILAQRVDSLGNICWAPNGVLIADSTPYHLESDGIVDDGNGGLMVVWTDSRNGNCDIFVQRIDSNGTISWDSAGVDVCILNDWQCGSVITKSGNNAIMSWSDRRSSDWDVYAQMVNSSGEIKWRINGIPVCTIIGQQAGFGTGTKLKITEDNQGGAFFAWDDRRMVNHDIYMQRVDSLGILRWGSEGVYIITAADSAQEAINFDMTTDSRDGAIICWRDFRNGNWDIYCQRVNDNGLLLWGDSGLAVCTDTQDQYWGPIITEDETGGVITTWGDMRPIGSRASIYAQRVGDAVAIQENIKKNENIEIKLDIYPNPAKGLVKIEWQIPERELVSLRIYDSQGRFIRKLKNGVMSKGVYIALWNGRDELNNKVPCGVYFCRLLTTKTSKIKKINLAW